MTALPPAFCGRPFLFCGLWPASRKKIKKSEIFFKKGLQNPKICGIILEHRK